MNCERAIHVNNNPQARDRATLHQHAIDIARRATNATRTENPNATMYRFLQFHKHDPRRVTPGHRMKSDTVTENQKTGEMRE